MTIEAAVKKNTRKMGAPPDIRQDSGEESGMITASEPAGGCDSAGRARRPSLHGQSKEA
jgi:hypothetical protein